MQFVTELLTTITVALGRAVAMILAVVLLVVVGAAMIGSGAVNEMQWLIYAGVVVAALGVIPIARALLDSA